MILDHRHHTGPSYASDPTAVALRAAMRHRRPDSPSPSPSPSPDPESTTRGFNPERLYPNLYGATRADATVAFWAGPARAAVTLVLAFIGAFTGARH